MVETGYSARMALARKDHGRSQVYLGAFHPDQLYNDEYHPITVEITRDAPPAIRPREEKLWEKVQREREQKRFDSDVQQR